MHAAIQTWFLSPRISRISTYQFLIPPHHKLPVRHPRFRFHVRDVGAWGEVVDVEGAAHVVHGEDGEELALHVGDGDGLHITTTVSTKIYFIMQNLTAKFREISYP